MLALLATAVAIGPETVQADFEDDAGVHSEAVMKLARLGVFDGTECGEGFFCPSEPVLRWTMAVWTVRVLDSIEPRDGVPGDGQLGVTQSRFVDVENGVWWLPYVERIADLGITLGCAVEPATYCPDEPVTRAQMASFLQRAFGLVASGSALSFVDVGQSVHTDAIQALAEAGITAGCAVNPARFCPDEPVTRAQMASFLQRAFVSFGGVCPTEDNSADQSTGAGAGGGSGGGGSGGGGSGGGGSRGGGGNVVVNPRVRTPTEPGAPTDLNLLVQDRALQVSWEAPGDDGGKPIAGYRIQWRSGDNQLSESDPSVTVAGGVLNRRIGSLDNGTQYYVRVRAINDVGEGLWSTPPASATPAAAPGVPREMTIEPGNQKLTVTWQPPADDGGSPVTGYLVQWKDTGEEFSDTERRATVTEPRHQIPSLDNGSTYTVQVRAVNLTGTGPPASETGVPVTVPGLPTSLTLRSNMGNLLVSWDEPAADDGGLPVTGYLVQWKDTGEEFSDTERRATVTEPRHQITGLTIGNEYTVSVAAINATGTGPAVTESLLLAENPGVPREMTIEPGNQKLTVTWQPPADDGGSPVTGYLVQWKDTGEEFSDTERRATVTEPRHQIPSLDNGSTYTVQVRAVNLTGTGPPASETGVPVTVPGLPTSLTLRSNMGNLLVSWDEPAADDGGLPVTGYLVQWKDTGEEFSDTERRATVTEPRHQITGLTIGNEYTVSVAAINATGTGPAVTESLLLAENPGVPREMTIEPGNQKLTVTWQPPADDGGSPVTGYLVQWKDTGEEFSDTERRATVTEPRHQIPSLDNGSTYTVQVRAVNLTGTGPPASETGVPVTVPGLPTSLTLRSNMGNLLVSWDEPADGGLPVTGYLVQWKDTGEEFSDTERRATVTEPRHQITGLTIGNEYTVSVAAINATGTGPAVTESLLLAENPGAPNSLVVTARNQNLAVSWQSPTSEGSTPISEYRVLWKSAGEDYDDSACSHRRVTVSASGKLLAYIGPFRNGDSYDVRVIAVNASGSGSPADTSGTPAAIPGRPLGLGAFSIDGGLHLAWDTPWNGGSPITEYRIQWIGTGQEYSETDRQATATATSRSHEITGLTNGAKYTVRVIALNANGSSEIAETTGEPGDAPGPPASLSIPFAHALFNLTSLEFEWSAPTDQGASPITRYWVSVRRGYENDYPKPEFTTGLDLEMDISCVFTIRLCYRTQHFVRVSAVNAQGVGPPIVKEFRPTT